MAFRRQEYFESAANVAQEIGKWGTPFNSCGLGKTQTQVEHTKLGPHNTKQFAARPAVLNDVDSTTRIGARYMWLINGHLRPELDLNYQLNCRLGLNELTGSNNDLKPTYTPLAGNQLHQSVDENNTATFLRNDSSMFHSKILSENMAIDAKTKAEKATMRGKWIDFHPGVLRANQAKTTPVPSHANADAGLTTAGLSGNNSLKSVQQPIVEGMSDFTKLFITPGYLTSVNDIMATNDLTTVPQYSLEPSENVICSAHMSNDSRNEIRESEATSFGIISEDATKLVDKELNSIDETMVRNLAIGTKPVNPETRNWGDKEFENFHSHLGASNKYSERGYVTLSAERCMLVPRHEHLKCESKEDVTLCYIENNNPSDVTAVGKQASSSRYKIEVQLFELSYEGHGANSLRDECRFNYEQRVNSNDINDGQATPLPTQILNSSCLILRDQYLIGQHTCCSKGEDLSSRCIETNRGTDLSIQTLNDLSPTLLKEGKPSNDKLTVEDINVSECPSSRQSERQNQEVNGNIRRLCQWKQEPPLETMKLDGSAVPSMDSLPGEISCHGTETGPSINGTGSNSFDNVLSFSSQEILKGTQPVPTDEVNSCDKQTGQSSVGVISSRETDKRNMWLSTESKAPRNSALDLAAKEESTECAFYSQRNKKHFLESMYTGSFTGTVTAENVPRPFTPGFTRSNAMSVAGCSGLPSLKEIVPSSSPSASLQSNDTFLQGVYHRCSDTHVNVLGMVHGDKWSYYQGTSDSPTQQKIDLVVSVNTGKEQLRHGGECAGEQDSVAEDLPRIIEGQKHFSLDLGSSEEIVAVHNIDIPSTERTYTRPQGEPAIKEPSQTTEASQRSGMSGGLESGSSLKPATAAHWYSASDGIIYLIKNLCTDEATEEVEELMDDEWEGRQRKTFGELNLSAAECVLHPHSSAVSQVSSDNSAADMRISNPLIHEIGDNTTPINKIRSRRDITTNVTSFLQYPTAHFGESSSEMEVSEMKALKIATANNRSDITSDTSNLDCTLLTATTSSKYTPPMDGAINQRLDKLLKGETSPSSFKNEAKGKINELLPDIPPQSRVRAIGDNRHETDEPCANNLPVVLIWAADNVAVSEVRSSASPSRIRLPQSHGTHEMLSSPWTRNCRHTQLDNFKDWCRSTLRKLHRRAPTYRPVISNIMRPDLRTHLNPKVKLLAARSFDSKCCHKNFTSLKSSTKHHHCGVKAKQMTDSALQSSRDVADLLHIPTQKIEQEESKVERKSEENEALLSTIFTGCNIMFNNVIFQRQPSQPDYFRNLVPGGNFGDHETTKTISSNRNHRQANAKFDGVCSTSDEVVIRSGPKLSSASMCQKHPKPPPRTGNNTNKVGDILSFFKQGSYLDGATEIQVEKNMPQIVGYMWPSLKERGKDNIRIGLESDDEKQLKSNLRDATLSHNFPLTEPPYLWLVDTTQYPGQNTNTQCVVQYQKLVEKNTTAAPTYVSLVKSNLKPAVQPQHSTPLDHDGQCVGASILEGSTVRRERTSTETQHSSVHRRTRGGTRKFGLRKRR